MPNTEAKADEREVQYCIAHIGQRRRYLCSRIASARVRPNTLYQTMLTSNCNLVADAIMGVSFFRDSAPEDFASFDRSFLAMCVAGVKLRVWVRRVGFGWIR